MNLKTLMVVLSVIILMGCGGGDTAKKFEGKQENTNKFSEMGKAFLSEGKVIEAVQSFDKAIQADPKNSLNYVILGQVYLKIKRYNSAVDTFTAATRVDPKNGENFYYLAMAEAARGRLDYSVNAAKTSAELFSQQKDKENLNRTLVLLKNLTESAKKVAATVASTKKAVSAVK